MTARGYARVSTGLQAREGFSLAAQKQRIHAWATYQGLTDVQVYEDAGISGTRDDRPALTALLLDLQPGDTVITYALSRLARGGAVQLLGIVRDIRAKQARVVFLQENIDTETSTGRLMLTILAALAELEIERTRELTDMGRTQAAQEGVYPHSSESLPFGWERGPDGRIVANAHADTVRLIFAQGTAPYRATAEMLNAAGAPSARGGKWTVVQVRRIVQYQPYATGQFAYRAATRPDNPDAHVVIPAPALVTLEEWRAAQRDARANHHHRRPDLYPLTGHLRCGCGARLAGRNNKPVPGKEHHTRHPQYVCFDHVRKTPTCAVNGKRLKNYRAHELHASAREALAELLLNPNDPTRFAETYIDEPARPDQADAERADLTRKLDALLDLYLEGVIDRHTYDARRGTLTARLGTLTPPPVPLRPPSMPARPDLAAAVLTCSHEELAEFLDILDVEFMARPDNTVQIVGFRPMDL